MAFRPVVTDGIRKYFSASTKTTLSYRLFQLFRSLKFGSRVFIPETEPSVRADSGESPVMWMKGYVIDCEYVLKAIISTIRSMALKREVIFWVNRIHVLNGNPSLNAT